MRSPNLLSEIKLLNLPGSNLGWNEDQMAIDVFVSVGRASTNYQEDFINSVEDLLRDEGLSPRAIGINDFSSKQPLQFVQELMQQCKGTVIIAFERIFIAKGDEEKCSYQAKAIKCEILSTVWNQI